MFFSLRLGRLLLQAVCRDLPKTGILRPLDSLDDSRMSGSPANYCLVCSGYRKGDSAGILAVHKTPHKKSYQAEQHALEKVKTQLREASLLGRLKSLPSGPPAR